MARIIPDEEQAVAFFQSLLNSHGFELVVDGKVGAQTTDAYYSLVGKPKTHELSTVGLIHNDWPKSDYNSMVKFYGQPGKHLTFLEFPYKMKLSWDHSKTATRTRVHTLVHDSLKRIFTKVLETYGEDNIERLGLNLYGGCYNYRNTRGGYSLSTHAWGAAVDIDPNANQWKWDKSRARMAGAEYQAWFAIWLAEGWVSLGLSKDMDYMHTQAARL